MALADLSPKNPLGNESLGVGALSYAGQFNMMAVADRDAYPDLDLFAAGIQYALDALATSTPAEAGGQHPLSEPLRGALRDTRR